MGFGVWNFGAGVEGWDLVSLVFFLLISQNRLREDLREERTMDGSEARPGKQGRLPLNAGNWRNALLKSRPAVNE